MGFVQVDDSVKTENESQAAIPPPYTEDGNGWLLHPSDRDNTSQLISYYGYEPCKTRHCVRKKRSEDGLCWQCYRERYEPEGPPQQPERVCCSANGCQKKAEPGSSLCRRCKRGKPTAPRSSLRHHGASPANGVLAPLTRGFVAHV